MSRFVEMVIAALFGAVITIVGAAFWFGSWQGRLDTLTTQMTGLAGRVQTVENRPAPTIAGINSNSERTIVDGNIVASSNRWDGEQREATAGRFTAVTCPEGYFVMGIRAEDADGGGACVECLTHVTIYCRQL